MNVIPDKRLAELGSRPRVMMASFSRRSIRELKAVPGAMRWLLGIDR